MRQINWSFDRVIDIANTDSDFKLDWRLKLSGWEGKASLARSKQSDRRGGGRLLDDAHEEKIQALKANTEKHLGEFIEKLFVEIFKAEQFYLEK